MKKLVALLVAGSIVMGGAVMAKSDKHLLRKDDKKHPTQRYDVTQGLKNADDVGINDFESKGNCKRNWQKTKPSKDYATPSAPKGIEPANDSQLTKFGASDAKFKRNWKKTKPSKDYANPSVPKDLKNPADRNINSNSK